LIFQAGNLDNSAYWEKADLSRAIPGETGTDIMKVTFSPRKAMAGNPEENLVLQQDDQLYIREIPQYSQALERKVFLEGEFLFPGEYAFSEGERLISVIERAGGLTEEAYPFGALFLLSSVKEVQRERLKEYVSKLDGYGQGAGRCPGPEPGFQKSVAGKIENGRAHRTHGHRFERGACLTLVSV
jgi:polysaccharide export outer membrane protein